MSTNKTMEHVSDSISDSSNDKALSVPAANIVDIGSSIPTVKIEEKELIEEQTNLRKKSSTFTFCSCFGNKSNDKTKRTITVPKINLPEIEINQPSSNISSTLKIKTSLHAPSIDLPSVDLNLPSTDNIHLPTLSSNEIKQSIDNQEKIFSSSSTTNPNDVISQLTFDKNMKIQNEQFMQNDTPILSTTDEKQSIEKKMHVSKSCLMIYMLFLVQGLCFFFVKDKTR